MKAKKCKKYGPEPNQGFGPYFFRVKIPFFDNFKMIDYHKLWFFYTNNWIDYHVGVCRFTRRSLSNIGLYISSECRKNMFNVKNEI